MKKMSRWLSMEMLNDETLMLILLKIPPIYLHRYKWVSKRWYTIISDQYFMRRYIEYHNNPSQHDQQHFMIHTNPLSQFVLPDHDQLIQHHQSIQHLADFSLKFLPVPRESTNNKPRLKIVGASHGLLLCKYLLRYYVCNPLTRQYLEVPPLEVPPLVGLIPLDFVGFRCEPLDPNSCEVEFMLLVVDINRWRTTPFKTHVFLSKTGKWESYDVVCPPVADTDYLSVCKTNSTLVFCNGFFHWCLDSPVLSIVAYDPINQPNSCRLMRIPNRLLPHIRPWEIDYIGVTEGRIRVMIHLNNQLRSFNVIELIDYDKGIFDLIYFVEHPRKFDVNSRFFSSMNGEIVYLLNWKTKKLVLFNMNHGSVQSTLDLSSICKKGGICYRAMPFTMTPWPTPIPKLPGSTI